MALRTETAEFEGMTLTVPVLPKGKFPARYTLQIVEKQKAVKAKELPEDREKEELGGVFTEIFQAVLKDNLTEEQFEEWLDVPFEFWPEVFSAVNKDFLPSGQ